MKEGFRGNGQLGIYGFNISSTQEDLHQHDALEQNPAFACGDKQLCGGGTSRYWSIHVCYGC